jgi:hypothetical protein
MITLCEDCSEGFTEDEQMNRIIYLTSQSNPEAPAVLWKNQEWNVCCTLAECERIMMGGKTVKLHVYCFVRLSSE